MTRKLFWGLFPLCLISLSAVCAQSAELGPKPVVTSPRLYVIDCGSLLFNKPELYNLKPEEIKETNISVTCYLVVHPKGTLLFDTGLTLSSFEGTAVPSCGLISF